MGHGGATRTVRLGIDGGSPWWRSSTRCWRWFAARFLNDGESREDKMTRRGCRRTRRWWLGGFGAPPTATTQRVLRFWWGQITVLSDNIKGVDGGWEDVDFMQWLVRGCHDAAPHERRPRSELFREDYDCEVGCEAVVDFWLSCRERLA